MTRLDAAAFALAALTSGCVENALFEVTLDLPLRIDAAGACVTTTDCGCGAECVSGACVARAYVVIQPRDASDNPFGDMWAGDDLEAVELSATERVVDEFGILSDALEADLHLKVRFCTTAACSALEDADAPEARFWIEHPFYQGETTSWAGRIETIPCTTGAPTLVGACAIAGCVDGFLAEYCRSDGRHLCE